MAAASMGRLDLVRLLIVDHGADVNIILTVTRERESSVAGDRNFGKLDRSRFRSFEVSC